MITEVIANSLDKEKTELLESFDFCEISDNYEEYIDPSISGIPNELRFEKQSRALAYPVRLDIHKFASKRDVLDFVEKRWGMIQKNFRKKSHSFSC